MCVEHIQTPCHVVMCKDSRVPPCIQNRGLTSCDGILDITAMFAQDRCKKKCANMAYVQARHFEQFPGSIGREIK